MRGVRRRHALFAAGFSTSAARGQLVDPNAALGGTSKEGHLVPLRVFGVVHNMANPEQIAVVISCFEVGSVADGRLRGDAVGS